MKKPAIIFSLLVSLSSFAQENFIVHFDKDKHELTIEAQSIMARVQGVLSINPYGLVELIGHTDNDGTDDYNIRLSEKRIDAVKKSLQTIPGIKFLDKAMGENNPLKPNSSEANKKLNRCVEIRLSNCLNINSPEATRKTIDRMFGPEASSFEFKANENITLTTSHGTQIQIEPFSFCDSMKKPVRGKVRFTIREFLSYPEMLFSGISMNSNNAILASDGFFDLDAMQGDEKLFLRNDKKIRITFNTLKADSSMQYFSGEVREGGSVNWVLPLEDDSIALSAAVQNSIVDNSSFASTVRFQQTVSNYIEARSITFDSQLLFLKNPTKDQKDSIEFISSMLMQKLNEDLTAKLIGQAFRDRDVSKLNTLTRILHLESIRFGTYDPAIDPEPKATVYLYKASSQREIDFGDVVFTGINFNVSNVISFEIAGWRSADYLINNENIGRNITRNQYLVVSNRLRFINCDRFLNQANTTKLKINIKGTPASTTFVIALKNIKSVIAGSIQNDGTMVFPALPIGEKANLLAYACVAGEFVFSNQEFIIGDKEKPVVDLKKSTFEEFKREIELF